MASPLRALALVGPSLAACQVVAPGREVEVVLRGDGDGVILARTATGCRADDVAVEVTGDAVAGGGWRLVATATGAELRQGATLAARIVDEPGPPARRSYLDPLGVPLARVTVTDDGAAVVGADRAPLGRVEPAERGTASAVRIERSGKVVTEPGGGLIDGESAALSPDRARLVFVTALEPPCDEADQRRLIVAEVATGRVRALATGAVTAPAWIDDDRVAFGDGDAVVVVAVATGAVVATVAGGAGVTTVAPGPRRRCDAAPPPFADAVAVAPDDDDGDDDFGADPVDAGAEPADGAAAGPADASAPDPGP